MPLQMRSLPLPGCPGADCESDRSTWCPHTSSWALVTLSMSGSLPTLPCLTFTDRHACDAHCTDEEGRLREADLLPRVTS